MKKILIITLLSTLFVTQDAFAQKVLKIGKTEILLQSPVKVTEKEEIVITERVVEYKSEAPAPKKKRRFYPRHIDEFYLSLGMAVKTSGETFQPIVYGSSYDFEVGWKKFYRPVRALAFGSDFHLTSYSYQLVDAARNGIYFPGVPRFVDKEFYRTTNAGLSLLMRLYVSNFGYLELGGYGDYCLSKRYIVKTVVSGDKDKLKFRDGTLFNPYNAGVKAAIGNSWFSVYAKYRLTDMFDHDRIDHELPRLHIGVALSF